jgi:putative transposase
MDPKRDDRLTGRALDQDVEELIVRMARENLSWGYDRIVGALANFRPPDITSIRD